MSRTSAVSAWARGHRHDRNALRSMVLPALV